MAWNTSMGIPYSPPNKVDLLKCKTSYRIAEKTQRVAYGWYFGITQQHVKTSEALLASAERILKKQETQNLPADIQASLKQLETTLGGFGPESTVYRELETTLRELNQVMAEFKPVLRTINEKPNALIFGESNTADPIPAKGKQEWNPGYWWC